MVGGAKRYRGRGGEESDERKVTQVIVWASATMTQINIQIIKKTCKEKKKKNQKKKRGKLKRNQRGRKGPKPPSSITFQDTGVGTEDRHQIPKHRITGGEIKEGKGKSARRVAEDVT